jgi:IstB-like ATP binding protein
MIHPTIETLRRLRLTGMAKALEEQQGLPDCDRLSFDERLAMLVDREAVERDNAALAQRRKRSICGCSKRSRQQPWRRHRWQSGERRIRPRSGKVPFDGIRYLSRVSGFARP